MKSFFVLAAIGITFLAACNSNNTKSATTDDSVKTQPVSATTSVPETQPQSSVKEIIAAYLQLKNALTQDNSNDAAQAGKSLRAALTAVNAQSFSAEQAKIYGDIADDAKEHAEHIGGNAGNIKHQREHFIALSKDIADMVKTFGNNRQVLYKDFCPMANNNKGAIWISETKEIKNPYLGKSMPTCGEVKEEMK